MTKYRNDDRDRQLDEELEREEAEYRKQFGSDQIVEEPKTPIDEPTPLATTSSEEETWKKRHGDLRSYTSKQINDLNNKVSELTAIITQKEREAAKLPTNKAELEAWMKDYPDLTRVLATLIETQTEYVKEDVKTVRQELEAERHAMAKEKAFNAVLRVHPDFATLVNSPDFQDWVETQPKPKSEGGRGRIGQALYDALWRNETDAEAAIEAVDVYKSDLAAKQPKKDTAAREAALSVKKSASSTPHTGEKNTFTESEIESMDRWTYDKYEKEIEAARREGRIVYDQSGAAR